MLFCVVCENMYYLQLNSEDENKLTYYCRNCGNINDTPTTNKPIIKTQISNNNDNANKKDFSTIINQYTKFDPTLPRNPNLTCPNKECQPIDTSSSVTEMDEIKAKSDVVSIRYDENAMKYVNLCCKCDTVWII